MSEVFAPGDKLHIITRRLFSDDVRRHFVGKVTAEAGDAVTVEGYVFVFVPEKNEYQRRPHFWAVQIWLGVLLLVYRRDRVVPTGPYPSIC